MRALLVMAAIVAFLSAGGCGLRAPLPTPLGTHVAPTSQGLELVWSIHGVYIPYDGALLRTNGTTVFLAGGLNGDLGVDLIALDQTTGALLWQQNVTPTALEVDDATVYAGAIDSTAAYDTSGERSWTTPLPLARTVTSVLLDGNQLNVITANPELVQLDRATGTILNREPAPGLLARASGTDYYTPSSVAGLEARSANSGSLWQADLGANASTIATINPDVLTLQTGGSDPRAFALDTQTGAIKWRSEQTVPSNVASAGELTAYLDQSGQLHIVDANGGRSIASADFAPRSFPKVDDDLHPRSYFVAVSADGTVIVYLGDSMELFAFRTTASNDAA